ncbi:MAG: hypothetical protein ACRYF9_26200 [Janthinobacterium lividum]
MTQLQSNAIGYLSPISDFNLHNTQALGGVSHLWQDFFARAMADQGGEDTALAAYSAEPALSSEGEPITGSQILEQIVSQRQCSVQDTEVRPPEPLFLPMAEFDLDLLPAVAKPFSADEIIAQQAHLDTDISWRRPVVMSHGQPLPEPGPAPAPRPLFLPIAEFETDLLPAAPAPFDATTLAKQQSELDFDQRWARPVVLENLRIAA